MLNTIPHGDPTTAQPRSSNTGKAGLGKSSRRSKIRINFDVTPKLLAQVRKRAMKQGLTVRGYMLKLLAAEGLNTSHRDLLDGRTLRAAGLDTAKSR